LEIKFPHKRSETLRDIIFYLGRWHTYENVAALKPKEPASALKRRASLVSNRSRRASKSAHSSATGSEGNLSSQTRERLE